MSNRPIIFDYSEVTRFIKVMIEWKVQHEPGFSIRKAVAHTPGVSHSLVSQVAHGRRKLTRDKVQQFSKLLGLQKLEATYLDEWVKNSRSPYSETLKVKNGPDINRRPKPNNHILRNWFNIYVKDAFGVSSSSEDPHVIHRILGGIVSIGQIKKSIEFLLVEGYLRRTLCGKIVKNDLITLSTDDVTDAKIQTFHRHALDIAKKAIYLFPSSQRRANAVTMTLDESGLEELNKLLKNFYDQLISFMEDHPNENRRLYQVIINLSPIGGSDEL